MSTVRANEFKFLDGKNVKMDAEIPDVSTLQSSSFDSEIDTIWLSGYYGVGTPGGGPLYRDPNDTSTADNGGTVFVDSDGVRWKRNFVGDLEAVWFGIKQDGSDDAPALQNAIDEAENFNVNNPDSAKGVILPSGPPIVLDSTITITKSRTSLKGQGPFQTILEGTFSTGFVLEVGTGPGNPITNIYLKSFMIRSSVSMSSGGGFHSFGVVRSNYDDLIFDGQDGNGNLWDGAHFDAFDRVYLNDFEARGQNNGILINGGNGKLSADLHFNKGKIVKSNIGFHIAGDTGGVRYNSGGVIDNETGIVIDQSQVAKKNRETFFGSTLGTDVTNTGPSLEIDDPNLGFVNIACTWIASATTHGVHVIRGGQRGKIVQTGGRIFNHGGDGIRIDDDQVEYRLGNTKVDSNSGWGINATVKAPFFKISPQSVSFAVNTLGDVNWDTIAPEVGQGFALSIPDDGVKKFFPPNINEFSTSFIYFFEGTGGNGAYVYAEFHTESGSNNGSNSLLSNTTIFDVTTGDLTGTTGTDGNITVSVDTEGKINVENRRGGQRDVSVIITAGFGQDMPIS